jgi:hypothetical protein
MKKIALAGLIALSLIALSQQTASAWVNVRFGIGLNWQWQSGGNNFLWGALHNGQVPGPEAFGGYYGSGQAAPMPYYSYSAPMPQFYNAPAPAYAGQYQSPYQFANYPRQVYYYPTPSFYYYGQ